MTCINKSAKEYQDLLKEANIKEAILDSYIGVYQNKNGYEKFPTLQELNIPQVNSVKSGVQEIFDSNPELSKIGTQQQYSNYLDTIFPESKVKDIVYHGTDKNFDKFEFQLVPKTGWTNFLKGFHFSNYKQIAESYFDTKRSVKNTVPLYFALRSYAKNNRLLSEKEFNDLQYNDKFLDTKIRIIEEAHYYGSYPFDNIKNYKEYLELQEQYSKDEELNSYKDYEDIGNVALSIYEHNEQFSENKKEERVDPLLKYKNQQTNNLIKAILNIKNPLIENLKGGRYVQNIEKLKPKLITQDGIVAKNTLDALGDKEGMLEGDTLVVFEPEQIHILGNKQDIEGFKEFINKNENNFLQTKGTETTKVNPNTIFKVKEFLKRNNINLEQLSKDYDGVNGVANLLNKTVEIANGKEDVALPEEAFHFFEDMIKTSNQELHKQLSNEVKKLPIFRQVKEEYSKSELYRNKDGSLNIEKIASEAITKQLTNDYINKENSSFFQKVINWLKGLLFNSFNPFEEAVKQFDTINQNVSSNEVYLQISDEEKDKIKKEINENIDRRSIGNSNKGVQGESRIQGNSVLKATSVPESFRILWKISNSDRPQYGKTIQRYNSTYRVQDFRKMEQQPNLPNNTKIFGGSLNSFFDSSRTNDMERRLGFYSYFIQSLNDNKFFHRLGQRIGLEGVVIGDLGSKPPTFYNKSTNEIFINTNKGSDLFDVFEKAYNKGVNIEEYLHKAIFEELIHATAINVLPQSIIEDAYKEITPEVRAKVTKYYKAKENISTDELLGNFDVFHELLRANIQKEFENDKSTEDITTTLYDKFKQIIDGIWNFLKNFINNSTYNKQASQQVIDFIKGNNNNLTDEFSDESLLGLSPINVDLKSKIENNNKKWNLLKQDEKTSSNDEEIQSRYTISKDDKQVGVESTTEWVKKRMIEKNGGRDYFANPTPEQAKDWEAKAANGTTLHKSIESLIEASLNEDGTLKPISQVTFPQNTTIDRQVYKQLITYLYGDPSQNKIGLLSTFELGSKIILEQPIYNEKTQRAGTIDMIVEQPTKPTLILDWKFMGFSLDANIDIPKNKVQQHAMQLGDYKSALKQLGEKDVEAKTIPFHVSFTYKDGLPIMKGLEVGNVNYKVEENSYLLPVLAEGQTTGNPKIDNLIKDLNIHLFNISNLKVDPSEYTQKKQKEKELSRAIRHLQVQLNFEPLSIEAKNFNNYASTILEKYTNDVIPDLQTINLAFKELEELEKDAFLYSKLAKEFVSLYGKQDLNEKDVKTLDSLEDTSIKAEYTIEQINEIRKTLALQVANIKEIKGDIFDINVEVGRFTQNFGTLGASNSTNNQLLGKIINEAESEAIYNFGKKSKEHDEVFQPAYQEAKKQGKDLYSLIGNSKTLKLSNKLSKEFWSAFETALKDKDAAWFKENIDKEEFEKLSKEYVAKQLEYIDSKTYNFSEEKQQSLRDREIKRVEDSFNLDGDFNPLDNYFKTLVLKTIKEEKFYTEEYKKIKQNEALFNYYNWIENFNQHLKEIGYLPKSSYNTFLPFVQATIIDRAKQSNNFISTISALTRDTYTVKGDDFNQFGKDEFGNERQSIPTPFINKSKATYILLKNGKEVKRVYSKKEAEVYQTKHDNITISQTDENFSRDVPHIMRSLIAFATKYEVLSNVENIALGLHTIEQAKQHLELDKKGNVKMLGDNPQLFEGNEKLSEMMKNKIDATIYSITSRTDTIDTAIGNIAGEEKLLNSKKALETGQKLVTLTALSVKPLIALANYGGGIMQQYINGGTTYKKNYSKSYSQIVSSNFQGEKGEIRKGLIFTLLAKNDNALKEVERHYTKDQSLKDRVKTWSYFEVMMSTNKIFEDTIELSTINAMLEHTIVRDGKLVNIDQFLKNKYKDRYKNPSTLREVEKTMREEEKELVKESIPNIAKFDEKGEIEIPGLSNQDKELINLRTKMIKENAKITGKVPLGERGEYTRDSLMKSFMTFKGWIPKQIAVRHKGINYDNDLQTWEVGRTKMFFQAWSKVGLFKLNRLTQMYLTTPEGVQLMSEMMEKYKDDYLKKTGKELQIEEHEFNDLMREMLKNEWKEIHMLLLVMTLALLVAKYKPPPDDKNKNGYNYLLQAVSKVSDEVWFYYSPTSADSIFRGNLFPPLTIISNATKLFKHAVIEGFAPNIDQNHFEFFNQDVREKNDVIKYGLNLIPGAKTYEDIISIIDPDQAKWLGVKVSPLARQGGQ